MSAWIERILKEFPAEVSRFWIAADPDDVLLDEQILSNLRARGFELLPFEDSVAFRADYEERYRTAWDRGELGPAKALVLQLRNTNVDELPWDYLRQARRISLSLADLFPKLSYAVVRQIDAAHLDALFEAQSRFAPQPLGEASTKEFVLTHIFRISPHLIGKPEELWRELLRLHYRDTPLPDVLAQHVARVLSSHSAFKDLPIAALFSSKSEMLSVAQDAWYRYLAQRGVVGTRVSEPALPDYVATVAIPFEHPDVHAIIDSMFLDGTLHPLASQIAPVNLPGWAKVGVVQDPAALQNLVLEGIKSLAQTLPAVDASYRDWLQLAQRLAEIIARFHGLDSAGAETLKDTMLKLQTTADARLCEWVKKHYADLPSLPVAKGPVMVHHIPRFLSMRRGAGEDKVALLVFDGLAVDQWVHVRESLIKQSSKFKLDEGACFAWPPTLTSVSRQALFSGLKPREFGDSIETTAQEPAQWSRFWQDHGLRTNEVLYRKGIKRRDQLADLRDELASPTIKVAGIVVDTVDEIVHGAALGKRGVANQIASWCESGFVELLFKMLLENGFHIYLTADHGNVDAVGQGRPNQGLAPEMRGERVRTYRTETLLVQSVATNPDSFRMDIAGLPANFMPLYASERTAFVPRGDHVVVHGGVSVEELIVPFIKISNVS